MTQSGWRKFHRNLGIVLVWFLALQAISGLSIGVGSLVGESPFLQAMDTFHFGWKPLGGVYRFFLVMATLAQGLSGLAIYFLMRARAKNL
jgi:hypothetical protein